MKRQYITPIVSLYTVDIPQAILSISDTKINVSDDKTDSYDVKKDNNWDFWETPGE